MRFTGCWRMGNLIDVAHIADIANVADITDISYITDKVRGCANFDTASGKDRAVFNGYGYEPE